MKIHWHTVVLILLLLSTNCAVISPDSQDQRILKTNKTSQKNQKAKKGKKQDKEEKVPETESPFEKLLKDVEKFFDKALKEIPHNKKQAKEGGAFYNLKDKNSQIEISTDGNTVLVSLTNEYESHLLEFEDVDFTQQEDMINATYLSQFLRDSDQILGNINQVYEKIEAGLVNEEYPVAGGESMFVEPKVLEKSAAFVEFSLKYKNPNVKFGSDPVMGTLKKGKNEYTLSILSKYFQKTFQLGIFTQSFMYTESMKIAFRVLSHLDSMYYLNENPSEDNVDRSYSFESNKDHLKNVLLTHLGDEFEVSVDEKSAKIEFDGKEVAVIEASQPRIEGGMYTVIKCKLKPVKGNPYTLVLPGRSIFEVQGLVDRFAIEMVGVLTHVMGVIPEREIPTIFHK